MIKHARKVIVPFDRQSFPDEEIITICEDRPNLFTIGDSSLCNYIAQISNTTGIVCKKLSTHENDLREVLQKSDVIMAFANSPAGEQAIINFSISANENSNDHPTAVIPIKDENDAFLAIERLSDTISYRLQCLCNNCDENTKRIKFLPLQIGFISYIEQEAEQDIKNAICFIINCIANGLKPEYYYQFESDKLYCRIDDKTMVYDKQIYGYASAARLFDIENAKKVSHSHAQTIIKRMNFMNGLRMAFSQNDGSVYYAYKTRYTIVKDAGYVAVTPFTDSFIEYPNHNDNEINNDTIILKKKPDGSLYQFGQTNEENRHIYGFRPVCAIKRISNEEAKDELRDLMAEDGVADQVDTEFDSSANYFKTAFGWTIGLRKVPEYQLSKDKYVRLANGKFLSDVDGAWEFFELCRESEYFPRNVKISYYKRKFLTTDIIPHHCWPIDDALRPFIKILSAQEAKELLLKSYDLPGRNRTIMRQERGDCTELDWDSPDGSTFSPPYIGPIKRYNPIDFRFFITEKRIDERHVRRKLWAHDRDGVTYVCCKTYDYKFFDIDSSDIIDKIVLTPVGEIRSIKGHKRTASENEVLEFLRDFDSLYIYDDDKLGLHKDYLDVAYVFNVDQRVTCIRTHEGKYYKYNSETSEYDILINNSHFKCIDLKPDQAVVLNAVLKCENLNITDGEDATNTINGLANNPMPSSVLEYLRYDDNADDKFFIQATGGPLLAICFSVNSNEVRPFIKLTKVKRDKLIPFTKNDFSTRLKRVTETLEARKDKLQFLQEQYDYDREQTRRTQRSDFYYADEHYMAYDFYDFYLPV